MDEPFAELDIASKKVLAENIESYSKNKIIIIITHEIPKELENKQIKTINMHIDNNIVTIS